MASPRHYGHSARDISNVMQKLQGRHKMLTHSHWSTLVCSVFRGDLASQYELIVTLKISYIHLILFAHDPLSLICVMLKFKFIWLINVWHVKGM